MYSSLIHTTIPDWVTSIMLPLIATSFTYAKVPWWYWNVCIFCKITITGEPMEVYIWAVGMGTLKLWITALLEVITSNKTTSPHLWTTSKSLVLIILHVATSLISLVLECKQNGVYFSGRVGMSDFNFICKVNCNDIAFARCHINMLNSFLVPEDECGDVWFII